MDNKYRYYELRNMAWQVLIDTQINALPIDINKILDYYNLQALTYDFKTSTERGAHATLPTGQTLILYSNTCNEQQARFTIMHELGHILLDHNNFAGSVEKEANSFAARILMPVGVLKKIYEKLPSGMWSVRFREDTLTGTKNKRLSGFKTKKDAADAYAKYINEKKLITTNVNNVTINELIDSYNAYAKSRTKESTQYEIKKLQEHYIIPYFKNKHIKEIDKKSIAMWQQNLNNLNLSYSYKTKIRIILSSIFKHAVFYFDLPANPVSQVPAFRNMDKKQEMQIWSVEEFKKFISVVDNIVYKSLFSALYLCGLRKGESLALTWNDIDFNNQIINIDKSLTRKVEGQAFTITTPKNASSVRKIKFSNNLLYVLQELKKHSNNQNNDFVFSFKEKTPIAENTLTRKFYAYCDIASVKRIRLHDLRHSHASYLISQGVDIVSIANRLGHSDIEQTLNTYSHIMPDNEKRLIEKLNFDI